MKHRVRLGASALFACIRKPRKNHRIRDVSSGAKTQNRTELLFQTCFRKRRKNHRIRVVHIDAHTPQERFAADVRGANP